MQIIKLSETDKYKKFNAVRKAKFDVVATDHGLQLIDKQCNAEQYIDTYFHSIDEILSVLAGYLLKVGIVVTI